MILSQLVMRRQQIAIAGLWMLLALPLILAAGTWLDTWQSATQRIDAAQQRIAHIKWIVDHGQELQQQFLRRAATANMTADFVDGASPEEATAHLQQQVKQLADSSGAAVISAQPLPARDEAGANIVTVRYQMTVSPATLVQLLYLLENTSPLLFIDSADINLQQLNAVQPGQAPSAVMLSLQLDIHAFARSGPHGA